MFIELSELLDCPACADGCGLVAFVRESDRRRVLAGHLGCPLCEGEVPIHRGVIDLDPSPDRPPAEPSSATDSAEPGGPAPDPESGGASELAVRVAALLGLAADDAGRAVLLGPGLAGYAPEIARLGERVEVLALFGEDERAAAFSWSGEDLAAGTNPIVGAGAGPWPIRAGTLDGIAWRGALGDAERAVRGALRVGGRLVLIDPASADPGRMEAAGIEPLAGDETAWVGVRR